MHRVFRIVALCALLALAAVSAFAADPQKDRENQLRTLTGIVYGQGDQPLSGAVVYLKNVKTLAVKSLYTSDSGEYRFNALAPNTDYEVFAEYKEQRSSTKRMSGFDSRPNVRINLHIDVAK